MARPECLGDSAWQTLLGVCAIAGGCAAVLKVLAASLLFATSPSNDEELEGNNPRKKAAELAMGDGFFDVETEKGKGKLRMGRGRACFFGGSLLRLYACDDRAALLMPMVTFLGVQSGFLVLNFLKVRTNEAREIYCAVSQTFLLRRSPAWLGTASVPLPAHGAYVALAGFIFCRPRRNEMVSLPFSLPRHLIRHRRLRNEKGIMCFCNNPAGTRESRVVLHLMCTCNMSKICLPNCRQCQRLLTSAIAKMNSGLARQALDADATHADATHAHAPTEIY